MTCQECELQLAAGNSPDDHLVTCAACRVLAEDLRLNAAALLAMRDETNVGQDGILWPVVNRPVRLSTFAAVAAALIAAVALWQPGHRSPVEPPRVAVAVTPPKFAALPLPEPAPASPVVRAKSAPLVVKMLTDDPDVVVYWLIDAKEGP